MEQQHDDALQRYRERLLASLSDMPRRQGEAGARRIHVFVNHDRVGRLDADRREGHFTFAVRDRSIQMVELRSETGALIGGLSAPDVGLRTLRLEWAGRTVNATVHNRLDGGSLDVTASQPDSVWVGIGQAIRRWLPASSDSAPQPGTIRGLALAQVAMFLAVAWLAADRTWERMMERPDPATTVATAVGHEIVSSARTQEALGHLDAQVQALLAAQTTAAHAVAGQQKTIQSVQRALDELAQQQKQIGTQMVSVQQMEAHQEKIAQRATFELDRMTKTVMGQVQSERVQLRDELHSLSMANEHLARHVSSMEKKNQEMASRLRSAGVEVSARVKDAKDGPDGGMMVAKDRSREAAESAVIVADARPEASPFTFFVSFQDGTTEETIDRWFKDLHARKGDADSGWYSVEVPRPSHQPADRFMEGLKDVKIVKAVATSRNRLPAR